MTIAFVTETYLPTVNGVVHAIELSARELTRRGHRVRIIAPSTHGVHVRSKELYTVPAMPFPGATGYQLAFPKFSTADRILRRADIVHTHHPFTMGLWAQRIAAQAGKPFLFTNHTQYLRYLHHLPVPSSLVRQPLSSYLTSFANRCTLVIAPAPATGEALQASGVTRPVQVVPNGIDTSRFHSGNGTAWRTTLGLDAKQFLLLFVGRLSEEKQIGPLLGMMPQLPAHAVLVIAGDGPQRDELLACADKLGIADRVRFTGNVGYDEMPDLYAAADAFVSASTSEVHPLTVIEAQAAGLPAVVADAPGTSEIVLHRQTGIVTKPTKTAFAAAVRQLLLRPALRHQYGRAAAVHAEQYSIAASVDRLLATYALSRRLVEAGER